MSAVATVRPQPVVTDLSVPIVRSPAALIVAAEMRRSAPGEYASKSVADCFQINEDFRPRGWVNDDAKSLERDFSHPERGRNQLQNSNRNIRSIFEIREMFSAHASVERQLTLRKPALFALSADDFSEHSVTSKLHPFLPPPQEALTPISYWL